MGLTDQQTTTHGRTLRLRDRACLAAVRWRGRLVAAVRDDRGDVPGWVLVTLMTAALVTALWFLAKPMLENVFTDAIENVEP